MTRTHPIALCLSGIDPSSASGIFRDVMTFARMGIYPLGVPIAETVQNSDYCTSINPPSINPSSILKHLQSNLVAPWGIKIGLCALDEPQFKELVLTLKNLAPVHLIWDPVIKPTSGPPNGNPREWAQRFIMLLDAKPKNAFWVLNPNLEELNIFSEAFNCSNDEYIRQMLQADWDALWVKDGHGTQEQVIDQWHTLQGVHEIFPHSRLQESVRGTGCSLSSLWLSYRLMGENPEIAAAKSAHQVFQDMLENTIKLHPQGRSIFGMKAL